MREEYQEVADKIRKFCQVKNQLQPEQEMVVYTLLSDMVKADLFQEEDEEDFEEDDFEDEDDYEDDYEEEEPEEEEPAPKPIKKIKKQVVEDDTESQILKELEPEMPIKEDKPKQKKVVIKRPKIRKRG